MVSLTSGFGGGSSGTLGPSPETIVAIIEQIVGPIPGLLDKLTPLFGGNVPTAGTPQLPGFDLNPFLARNREVGGPNALLADVLAANLAPAPPVQAFGGGLSPPGGGSSPGGQFGLGNREPNNPGVFGNGSGLQSILRNTVRPSTAALGFAFGGPLGGALGLARDIFRAPNPITTRPVTGQTLAEVLSRSGGIGFREDRDRQTASNRERFGNERAPQRERTTGRATGRV